MAIRNNMRLNKLYTLLANLLIFSAMGYAQTDFYVGGGVVSSTAGTPIKVTGNVEVGALGSMRLNALLELEDNLLNAGNFHSTHTVAFTSSGNLTYTANGRDTIGDLQVDATSLLITDTLEILGVSNTDIQNTSIVTDNLSTDLLLVANNTLPNTGGRVTGPLGLRPGSDLNFPISNVLGENRSVLSDQIILSSATSYVIAEALNAPVPDNPGAGVGAVLPDNSWYVRYLDGMPISVSNLTFQFNTGVPVGNIPGTSIVQSPSGFGGPYQLVGNDGFVDTATPYSITANGASLSAVSLNMGYFAFGQCIYTAGNTNLINLTSTLCENDTIRIEASGFDPLANLEWIRSTDNGATWSSVIGQTSSVFYTRGEVPGNANPTLIALATSGAGGCLPDTSAAISLMVNTAIKLDLKVFLEGPYVGPAMSTSLSNTPLSIYSSLLDSVYSEASPVTAIDGNPVPKMHRNSVVPVGAVDVIKVELWDGPLANRIDTANAWLMSDGSVKDFYAGASADNHINFCDVANGTYHIVVRHRNHLSIVSGTPYSLSATPINVDLTVTANILGGTAFSANLFGSRGLRGGNIYNNPQFADVDEVNSADLFLIRVANNNLTGNFEYSNNDVNMNGFVNAADLNIVEPNARNLRTSNAPHN